MIRQQETNIEEEITPEKNPSKGSILNTYNSTRKFSTENPVFSPVNFGLTAQGGVLFFDYLKKFNLVRESNIVTIYPQKSFFYDENDFVGINTILVLKKLNLINDLEGFLRALDSILPHDVNFIGCFSDYRRIKGNNLITRLYRNVLNLLDLKTDNELDRRHASAMLKKCGFKIIDMSEMNGLVYFFTRPVNQSKGKMDLQSGRKDKSNR